MKWPSHHHIIIIINIYRYWTDLVVIKTMLSSIILCVRLEFIDFEYQHQEDFKQIKGSQALMMYLMDALAKIKKIYIRSWFVTFWYRRLHSCSLNSVVMKERSETLSRWFAFNFLMNYFRKIWNQFDSSLHIYNVQLLQR